MPVTVKARPAVPASVEIGVAGVRLPVSLGADVGLLATVYFDRGNGLYGLRSAAFRVRCVQ